ncbi:MAG: enoyl-CoA hydratase/isomerase family protein [Deltaproteobacteria bacterium]|nr:enoyl-CoA hydratase/isomerase family protein [Deltaproteobacteria bacterium]
MNIDNAMKWGYNWDLGPFEVWDAIGVAVSVAKMEAEGFKVPDIVKRVINEGKGSFYLKEGGVRKYFDFASGAYKAIEKEPTVIILPDLKDEGRVINENFGATLYDIGDGVACLEFHTKMNAVDDDIITMITDSVDEVERNFKGLVVSGHAENFSVGANLGLILMGAQMGNWTLLEDIVRKFQKANMRMKYAKKPVVAAPFGMALGGGCEIVLHAGRIQAFCELYMGLVEVGAGVIPAAGGCTQTVVRCLENIPVTVETSRMPFIRRAFELIGMAKVSFSAEEARRMGYLRDHDNISLSRDNLINDAKKVVIALSNTGYKQPLPPDNLLLPGKSGAAMLRLGLYSWRLGGMLSEHDELIGQKLSNILCGGECNPKKPVTEQRLLDLETEAFLSLCGMEKSQARMKSLLETGKPLRN